LAQLSTANTAESSSSGDLARASLGAGGARLGALGPSDPTADDAIHRAGLLVAYASGLEARALLATVSDVDADAAALRLRAGAARLGALGPGAILADDAIHRAGLLVARLALDKIVTVSTTVGDVRFDASFTSL
jgi:hypothetical protein